VVEAADERRAGLVPDIRRAFDPLLVWLLVWLPAPLLEHPVARRTSDKTVHLLPHRNLRKRPFVHPVRLLYRKSRVLARRYESLPGLTA